MARLLLGRIYNRVKKAHAGAPSGNSNAEKQCAQFDPIVSDKPKRTADRLAAEHGAVTVTGYGPTDSLPHGTLAGH